MTNIDRVSVNFWSSQSRSRHATFTILAYKGGFGTPNRSGRVVVTTYTDIMSRMGTTGHPCHLSRMNLEGFAGSGKRRVPHREL